jgi:hypothetical protein
MRDYGSLPMRLRLVLDAKDLHMDSKPVFSRQPFLQQTHVSSSKNAVLASFLMVFRAENGSDLCL